MMVKKKLARIKRWSAFTKVFSKIALPVVIQRIQEVIRGKGDFAKNSLNMTSQVVDLRGMRCEQERTIQVDQGECIPLRDPIFFTEIHRKCQSATFTNDDGSCAHVISQIREVVSDQFISLLWR
jgi:hypothetical protein